MKRRKGQRIAVVGLGYVGLSTAVCMASRKVHTIGIDVDGEKLELLKRGRASFEEKGLAELLRRSIREGTLSFTDSYREGVEESDILMVTVGTPSMNDGSTDLNHVKSASESIAMELGRAEEYKLVAVKSTVPAGTTAGLVKESLERLSGKRMGEFGLASNPEFLREGSAVEDTLRPDRIVIGSLDAKSALTLEEFYVSVYGKATPPFLKTSPTNAELIKYASNAFLATKISFVNELANLCSSVPGADVSVVALGMGMDRRISPHFLKAGLGWGGSCFPKDLSSLLSLARGAGVELAVAEAAKKANEAQPLVAVELAEELLGGVGGKRIALLGLSFKPGTDDMRDAVSVRLIEELLRRGAEVVAYDPKAIPNARKLLGGKIELADSAKRCIEGADCCILVTEWAEFSKLRPSDFKRLMKTPAVVDGRRVFDPKRFGAAGVRLAAVGLGQVAGEAD